MRRVADPVVVIGSALVVALFAACAPNMVVPAEGTGLDYGMCGQTSNGVLVLNYEATCPDLARVTERARRVKERYRDCALDGVRIHVVGAYVLCDGESVRGCQTGNLITVTADAFVIPTIQHELTHVCITQRDGPDGFAHYDLDRRKGRADGRSLMHQTRDER